MRYALHVRKACSQQLTRGQQRLLPHDQVAVFELPHLAHRDKHCATVGIKHSPDVQQDLERSKCTKFLTILGYAAASNPRVTDVAPNGLGFPFASCDAICRRLASIAEVMTTCEVKKLAAMRSPGLGWCFEGGCEWHGVGACLNATGV